MIALFHEVSSTGEHLSTAATEAAEPSCGLTADLGPVRDQQVLGVLLPRQEVCNTLDVHSVQRRIDLWILPRSSTMTTHI